MISQNNKQGWRNPWVIGLLLVVLAGVLINARMLWNVVHNPTRLLDENYSVKNHDKHDAEWIQQQAERSTLGWQVKLSSPQQLQNDALATADAARFYLGANPATIKLDIKDRDGNPVKDAQVSIVAQWPGDPKFDFPTELKEQGAAGYQGEMKFSRAGNWDLIFKVKRNGSEFEMEQKVFAAFAK
jgi:cell division protein FtsL